jgi:hypothetical protein
MAAAFVQGKSAGAEDSLKTDEELVANKAYNGPTAYGFSFKYPQEWKASKVGVYIILPILLP